VLEERTVLSFTGPLTFAAGSSPADVLTADFNNDGNLDLAVLNSGSNAVSVLLGNGDGMGHDPRQVCAGLV
jgi:hypothetical protein